mmetsp:Transcript_10032/g.36673  ORF Transcript_10032/g.36673 Transcript_10032/m.36673 type:complete len:1129 (+) Transcript_10032:409-3795(+)
MASSIQLRVAYTPQPSCLIGLPPDVVSQLGISLRSVVAVAWLPAAAPVPPLEEGASPSVEHRLYAAWSGEVTLPGEQESQILMPRSLAACAGIPEGTKVTVWAVGQVPRAKYVELEPVGCDDWEIVELRQDAVEAQFVNQVGAISPNMTLPVWVNGREVMVKLRVLSVEPNLPVVVPAAHTELTIAPKPRATLDDERADEQAAAAEPEAEPEVATEWTVYPDKRPCVARIQRWQTDTPEDMSAAVAYIHRRTAIEFGWVSGQHAVLEGCTSRGRPLLEEIQAMAKDVPGGGASQSPQEPQTDLNPAPGSTGPDGAGLPSGQDMLGGPPPEEQQPERKKRQGSPVIVQVLTASHGVAEAHVALSDLAMWRLGVQVGEHCRLERHTPREATSSFEITLSRVLSTKQRFGHGAFCDEDEWGSYALSDAQAGSILLNWLRSQRVLNPKLTRSVPIFHGMPLLLPAQKSVGKPPQLQPFSSAPQNLRREGAMLQLSVIHEKESDIVRPNGSEVEEIPCCVLVKEGILERSSQANSVPVRGGIAEHGVVLKTTRKPRAQTARVEVVQRVCEALRGCRRAREAGVRPSPGGLLLVGSYSARADVVDAVVSDLEQEMPSTPPFFCKRIDCARLSMVSEDVQREVLMDAFFMSGSNSPSVLFLDEADVLFPVSEGADQEHAAVETMTAVVARFLERNVLGHQPNGQLTVLSCASPTPMLERLCERGLLTEIVDTTIKNKEENALILRGKAEDRGLECSVGTAMEANAVVSHTDEAAMIERAMIDGSARAMATSESMMPTAEMRSEDVSGWAKLVGNRAGLDEDSLASDPWAAIGGLDEVKSTLQRAFAVPMKYPSLFRGAPLRQRTGCLLFGPSGCGKTHTVKIAAKALKMRLVVIKGPELLNKYIGASEQAVRSTFDRARAMSPCVLFFDEFESLAPRRGNDSTGVTDRVVNQLLTELDGVQALQGVSVLAATSRPDMIDPALLRPGRLDWLLFCGMPERQEREAILGALLAELDPGSRGGRKWDHMAEYIAARTDGFSGADLQGLLESIQANAITEEALDSARPALESIVVPEGVDEALRTVRPSVGQDEYDELMTIYSDFMNATSRKGASKQKAKLKGKVKNRSMEFGFRAALA